MNRLPVSLLYCARKRSRSTAKAPLRRVMRYRTLLLLLALPGLSPALPTDREQPVHIRAQRVEINEQTGVSIYRGDVELTQGSMQLMAERLIVYRQGDVLERIEAEGRPARFRQEPGEGIGAVRGEARHIEYHTDSDTALLIGASRVWRGQDEFQGERIEYDAVKNIVRATAGGEDGERVHAVLHPKPKESTQ